MMFVWDFVSHLYSSSEHVKILFFVLKIITMQIQPLGIYYTTYYKVLKDNP
jgi:hypothetical protein